MSILRGIAGELPGLTFSGTTIHFVQTVRAIFLTVADPSVRDTEIIGSTIELVWFAGARKNVVAILFVRSVSTVFFAIAFESVCYTSTIVAFELRLGAFGIIAIELVPAISAIFIQVADPVSRDAFVLVAFEFHWATAHSVTVPFVGIVTAIIVVITFPEFGNAKAVVTCELSGGTGGGYARTSGIGVWFFATRTHAFTIFHYHAVGA